VVKKKTHPAKKCAPTAGYPEFRRLIIQTSDYKKIMKAKKTILLIMMVHAMNQVFGQYTDLWIPDTLSGTHFNLNLVDTFAQLRPGNQTITEGVNNKFWGPT